MKVKFFTNAAMNIIAGSTNILCDPWFTPGAFDGSWYQFPPLQTKPVDLSGYTHIYISHIHTDHCDVHTLRQLSDKNVPVIILKRDKETFLRRKIESCGFRKFIEIRDGESTEIAPGVVVTMYQAFDKNPFIESAETPNVIDSSIVVVYGGEVIFNANDNEPKPEDCVRIRKKHGHIDLALLPYCGVGPFPCSYRNTPRDSKIELAREKSERYLNRLVENAKAIQADMVIPCAGQMILGGIQSFKNPVIGCAESVDAEAILKRENIPVELLWENDEYDVSTKGVTRGGIGPCPNRITKEFYLKEIAGDQYWWQKAFQVPPEERIDLLFLLQLARERMARYQGVYPYDKRADEWYVAVKVEGMDDVYTFQFTPGSKVEKVVDPTFFEVNHKFLMAIIPYNYLVAILTRHCHWNNAYHGCHIDWLRFPDEFLPDIQQLMSYFHI